MSATDNTFYIIVKKDTTKGLTIHESTANDLIKDAPNAIITGDKTGYFKVQVIPGEDGGIVVDGKNYKLVLDKEYTGTGTQILSSATFAQAAAAAAAPAAAAPAADTNGTVDNNGDDAKEGGQKNQHKNHNKRSYSKKNRKSRSKSDTLRNYFNYSAIETM